MPRLSSMTPNEKADAVPEMAVRWDAIIIMFDRIGLSDGLGNEVANRFTRPIILQLMEDGDLYLDMQYRKVSKESVTYLAKKNGLSFDEMHRWLTNNVRIRNQDDMGDNDDDDN